MRTEGLLSRTTCTSIIIHHLPLYDWEGDTIYELGGSDLENLRSTRYAMC